MIYWTNILIQCPVPVRVCCVLFLLENVHIKQSPNTIKIYGELFWNICDFWDLESTQMGADSPTRHQGAPQGVRHTLGRRGHLIRRLVPFFRCKKANIRIEIVLKFQPN